MSIENKEVLIIIGVGKAGTSSLFNYLSQHPDICGSDIKEVNYFLPLRYGAQSLEPLMVYEKHFAQCRSKRIFLEASPGYFPGGKVIASQLNQLLPNSKIILVFREPVNRLFSFYNFYKTRLVLEQELKFSEYIKKSIEMTDDDLVQYENRAYRGLKECFYDELLPDWLDEFPAERIKIFFFEKIFANMDETLEHIFAWLGLDKAALPKDYKKTVVNKTTGYRNKMMQAIALKINKIGERFWNQHSEFKTKLRAIYYRMNSKPIVEKLDEENRKKLNLLFKPHNERLKQILWAHGITDLPQ